MTVVGEAFIAIRPDTKDFQADTEKSVTSSLGSTAKKAAGAFVAGFAAVKAVSVFKGFISDAQESAKVSAQTAAVIKSTGAAAGVSADEVGKLAGALSAKTGIDDEAIQSGQNLLLTFTQVQNRVGAGNDVFNQASKTLLDMSAAMGGDASGSAIQLGKALNDPVQGISALSRVGVTFSAQQKEQIKNFVEAGKVAEAQKIILGELNKEFGGSAEAQATGFGKLQVVIGNLREEIGAKLLPIVESIADFLSHNLPGALDLAGRAFSGLLNFIRPLIDGARQLFTGLADGIRGIDPGDKLAGQLEAAQGRVTKARQDAAKAEAAAAQKVTDLETGLKSIRIQASKDIATAITKHSDEIKAAHQKVITAEEKMADETEAAEKRVSEARTEAADTAEEQAKRVAKVEEDAADRNRSAAEKAAKARTKAADENSDAAKKTQRAEEDLAKARASGDPADIERATRALEDARTDQARTARDTAADIADAEADAAKAVKDGARDVADAKDEEAKAVKAANDKIVEAEKARVEAAKQAARDVADARKGEAESRQKLADDIAKIRDKEVADERQARNDLVAARRAVLSTAQQSAKDIAAAEAQKVRDIESANARFVKSLTGLEADARRIGGEIKAAVLAFFNPDDVNTDPALAKFVDFGVKARDVFDEIKDTITNVVTALKENLPLAIGIAVGAIILFGGPVTATIALFGTLYVKSQLFRDIVAGIPAVISGIVGAVRGTVDTVAALWGKFGAPIQLIIDGILTVFVARITGIKDVLQGVVTFVTGVFSGDWGRAWDGLKQVALAPFKELQSTLEGFGKIASGALQGLGALLSPVWSSAWNGLKSTAKAAIDGVVGFVTGLPARITAVLGSIGSAATSVGSKIATGIADGILGLVGKTSSIGQQIITAMRATLGDVGKFVGNLGIDMLNGILNMLDRFKFSIGGWELQAPFPPHPTVRFPTVSVDLIPGTFRNIPHLAQGGVVNPVAGGVQAIIGEAGRREGVFPLAPGLLEGLQILADAALRGAFSGGTAGPVVGQLQIIEATSARLTAIETVRELRAEQYRRHGR